MEIWRARASSTQLELRQRLEVGTELSLPLSPLGVHLMTGDLCCPACRSMENAKTGRCRKRILSTLSGDH